MRVNLLPERLKPKKHGLRLTASPSLNILIRVFLALWVTLAICLVFVTHKAGQIRDSLSKIELAWGQTAPLIEERDALIKRKQELSSFLSLLEKDFKRKVVWSKKLSSLSDMVPLEIWIKEINFTGKDKNSWSLDILAAVGYLRTDEEMLDKINGFIERIKADPVFFEYFEKVSLLEINKTGSEKGNIMDFRFRIFSIPAS